MMVKKYLDPQYNTFRKIQHTSVCINSNTCVELDLLDIVGYFITLLFIADSHVTFPNFFILYATNILDSEGMLCFR
jgi:hypothetical protein